MANRLEVWIPGQPVVEPKLVPCRWGKRIGMRFDPEQEAKAKPYREKVVLAVKTAMLESGFKMIMKPEAFYMELTFHLRRPKTSKLTHPTVRPDDDNLSYLITNALTGVAYEDDSQRCFFILAKKYAPIGEESGVNIRIWTL